MLFQTFETQTEWFLSYVLSLVKPYDNFIWETNSNVMRN